MMMEFLNWAGEHPFLTFFTAWVVAHGIGSLGNIGSRRTTIKVKLPKED